MKTDPDPPMEPAVKPSSLRRLQRYRMIAAVLAPVMALVAFSGYVVEEKLASYRASADLLLAARVAQSAHKLARDVENERSVSALHIATGRGSWRPEVDELRAATDRSADDFRRLVHSPAAVKSFGKEAADLGLGEIDAARAAVDGDADLRTVLVSYSEVIGRLMSTSAKLSAADAHNLIAAYMDLGHIKDRVGRERSIGASWLLQGSKDPELLRLFAEAHAEKKAFMESFRGHASASQLSIFDSLMRSPILDELDRLHERVLRGKLGPGDADVWQRSHLAMADLLTRAEERLAAELETRIRADLSAAEITFYVVVLVVVGLVVFSLETLRRSERRASVAEEEARKLFRAVEQSPVSVMITDPRGDIEYVNPAFARMTGYDRDEAVGRNPRILRSDQTPKEVYADLWHAISSGHDWRGELVNKRKDGSVYWERITIAPVKNQAGEAVNYIALKEDVTEIRTLRQALEREHDNLRRILDSTHDGIALLAPDGSFQFTNSALAAEFGPVDGRRCDAYFDDATAPCPSCDHLGDTGGASSRREWTSRSTGKVYELTSTPVPNGDGTVSLLQVFHDITLRKQAEEAVNAAREAAELANRAKSEFLATMSHELRTPLNAIIGFSEIIEGELLGPAGTRQYVEYAHDINESGRHLLRLINDILDVARIEVGRITLREEDLEVRGIVQAAVNMVRDRAEANHVALTIKVPDGLPQLNGDERRLKQVLVNLLGNAVKFTPSGGRVEVSARLADGAMEIAVADTGIGIAAEDIAKIMAPFGQADSSMARRFDGSGLGLPLARKLVDLHGGSLKLDSTPGVGTVVTLRFPAERVRVPVTP
ncbi:MAG: nitrate- and nitrite sensing domain-containing protein [Pseudomonadota bacterium]